eukprot:jgi/Tetstr1/458420/TSEL_044855.t1
MAAQAGAGREVPPGRAAWGELPESVLNALLATAAPGNHTAVNRVNKRWKAQHAAVVRHLAPPVWDAAWLGQRFPQLVTLVLDDHAGARRPPLPPASGLLPSGSTAPPPLDGRVVVSDMDLIGVATLSSLQALALKSATPVTAPLTRAGVSALVCGLTALTALRLDHCKMTGGAMAALGELRTLRCLHLKDQQTRDEHMASLGKLTGLTSLYLEGCCLGDDGMAALGGLRALRTLCISSSRDADSRLDVLVTNAGLETLAALPNLQALDLDCCSHVEGHGLLGLTGLTSLGLSKLGGLSREAMKAVLIKLTALTGLDLLDCPQLLGHHGMDLWTVRCPALRSLRLCCMLSAELQGNVFMLDPAFLTHCPNLTELNLGQSSFIHNGSVVKLAALFRAGRLTNLRKLWLSACDSGDDPHFGPGSNDNLTDEGLMHLAGVSSLQSLCLAWNTRITCRGLAHLVAPTPGLASRAGLTQLRELDLTSCDSIGDMGVSWLAMHISSLQAAALPRPPPRPNAALTPLLSSCKNPCLRNKTHWRVNPGCTDTDHHE